jgi:RND family efflux transporter MFP subunit
MRAISLLLAVLTLAGIGGARAAESYTVIAVAVRDEKAVFATVESRHVIAARVRTPGTVIALSVREGDLVDKGQVIAIVVDKRLKDQADALDAQIVGLRVQQAQAVAERDRNRSLLGNGVISQSAMDGLTTAAALATAAVKAREAERSALMEQITQGQVLAPAAGRVLSIPLAVGSVVMSGETLASVAKREMVVRMILPESNAKNLTLGDPVRIDGEGVPNTGSISLIYPHIQEGRVAVDVTIPDSDSYFVGQRVRAWIRSQPRDALAIPAAFLSMRFGVDYARVNLKDGVPIEVPVQPGHTVLLPDRTDFIEILSGLKTGDVLVRP